MEGFRNFLQALGSVFAYKFILIKTTLHRRRYSSLRCEKLAQPSATGVPHSNAGVALSACRIRACLHSAAGCFPFSRRQFLHLIGVDTFEPGYTQAAGENNAKLRRLGTPTPAINAVQGRWWWSGHFGIRGRTAIKKEEGHSAACDSSSRRRSSAPRDIACSVIRCVSRTGFRSLSVCGTPGVHCQGTPERFVNARVSEARIN